MDIRSEKIFLKERVLENLDKLSMMEIENILLFTDFLIFKTQHENLQQNKNYDQGNDPILESIGIANVEPFAHNIDKEVYGGNL